MIELSEVVEVFRNGTTEQCDTLLSRFPKLVSHQFTLPNDQLKSTLEIGVETHDHDKLMLLVNRGVSLQEGNARLIHSWLHSIDYSRPFSEAVLAELVKLGLNFSGTKEECARLLQYGLDRCFRSDDIELFECLMKYGFDPVECEHVAGICSLNSALKGRSGPRTFTTKLLKARSREDCSTRVALRMIELGCNTSGTDDDPGPMRVALRQRLYNVCRVLHDKGVDVRIPATDRETGELLETLLCLKGMPGDILALFMDALDPGYVMPCGTTTLHLAACRGNVAVIDNLCSRGVDINTLTKTDNTPVMCAAGQRQKEAVEYFIKAGADLNLIAESGGTVLDIAQKQKSFKQVCTLLQKAGAKTKTELDNQGQSLPFAEMAMNTVQTGEPWAEIFRQRLADMPDGEARNWHSLCQHCADNDSAKPSKKWLTLANQFVQQIGVDTYRDCMLELMPLVKKQRTAFPENDYGYEDIGEYQFSANNTRVLKGLLWLCTAPDDELSVALRELASAMYRKVPYVGMRSAKLANACVYALAAMPGDTGLKQIITLRSQIKYNAALVNVNRVFDRLAKERNVTPEELEELSVPDYGLQEVGGLSIQLGNHLAVLHLGNDGSCNLVWECEGKKKKTVPAAIKRDFASELKALKVKQKDLKAALSAHRQRLEGLYLRARSHPFEQWREQYLDHNLIGFLARRLIWVATCDESETTVFWHDNAFVDSAGAVVEAKEHWQMSLWHPCRSTGREVLAWRKFLIDNAVTQPFKQAHREIYVLTDAEREAGQFSTRFANHILKMSQFHALATQRGWSQNRGGRWDGGSENSAMRRLPQHGIEVVFTANGIDAYGTSQTGMFECVGTGSLFFRSAGTDNGYRNQRIEIHTIEPLLFSEIMRDIDLFVGVCSVANDPEWQSREVEYWSRQHEAALSATAQTRREVLESLIPKLAIASRLTLEDRYLVVQGKLRQYRIHLGSSNIKMSPNDRYLCIVPAGKANQIMLPFEGDKTLSLILSKAFLLVDDHKIKDSVIVEQLMAA